MENQFLQQLKQKWYSFAVKKAQENSTKENLSEEHIFKNYMSFYKEASQDDLKQIVENFKRMVESPEWGFFKKLIEAHTSMNFENATFTEKQAFSGYRNQILSEIIALPVQVIEMYDAIQTQERLTDERI